MDLKDIQLKQARFVAEREWQKFHTVENLCKAICVEAGELLEIALWKPELNIDEIAEQDRKHIEEEVADIFLYTLSLCNVAGIDPIEAMKEKMARNEEKYPKDIYKGRYRL